MEPNGIVLPAYVMPETAPAIESTTPTSVDHPTNLSISDRICGLRVLLEHFDDVGARENESGFTLQQQHGNREPTDNVDDEEVYDDDDEVSIYKTCGSDGYEDVVEDILLSVSPPNEGRKNITMRAKLWRSPRPVFSSPRRWPINSEPCFGG